MNNIKKEEDQRKYFHSDQEVFIDIFEMFSFYNTYFFDNILDKCVLKWSKRMTLCAGTCKYQGFQSSTITLSEPLLKYRSSNELKETLLHEMIHAYLFITSPESCKQEQGHGPNFRALMNTINFATGLKITVFHKFHDEVRINRTHVWRCNGKCKDQAPYYGYVRRAMNRPPQKSDSWFARHEKECGGKFQKISEPKANSKPQKDKKSKEKKQKSENTFKGKALTLQDYIKKYEKQKEIGTEKIQHKNSEQSKLNNSKESTQNQLLSYYEQLNSLGDELM